MSDDEHGATEAEAESEADAEPESDAAEGSTGAETETGVEEPRSSEGGDGASAESKGNEEPGEADEPGEPGEPDEPREPDDRNGGRIETLETEVEEREERIEELESRLKRTQADFQNYKKRAEKRRERMEERATEGLVERLLDVRENLKRALEEESDDVEALRDGVKMTLSEFDRVLDAEGVQEIEPDAGEEVDPQRHEVMMRVESDRPEGAIDEVYASGYEMGEKVLRPAQVTVSEGSNEG
jgi:molecular chaperone GrpE